MGDNEKRVILKSLLDSRGRLIGESDTKAGDMPKERLTHRQIEELMGTKRDTYRRYRGAVRRR